MSEQPIYSASTERMWNELPIFIQRYDADQQFPEAHAEQGEDFNYIKNPSAEVDTIGWSVSNGYLNRTVDHHYVGKSAFEMKATGTGAFFMDTRTSLIPVTAGQPYSGAFRCRAESVRRNFRMRFAWKTSATADLTSFAENNGPTVAGTTSSWAINKFENVIAPSGATHLLVKLEVLSALANEIHWTDAIMVVHGSTVPNYFDGDSKNAEWTGQDHLSTSHRLVLPASTGSYPLKRWFSGIGDELGDVDATYDRIDYIPLDEGGDPTDTSDLVNPDLADDEWLDWLAQTVGVDLPAGLTEEERRDAVRSAAAGYRVATRQALEIAARSALTGPRHLWFYDHTVSDPGDGGEWDILVVTVESETPGGLGSVVNAIIRKNAKPVGVIIRHRFYEATWDILEAAYPEWDMWDQQDWNELRNTGL